MTDNADVNKRFVIPQSPYYILEKVKANPDGSEPPLPSKDDKFKTVVANGQECYDLGGSVVPKHMIRFRYEIIYTPQQTIARLGNPQLRQLLMDIPNDRKIIKESVDQLRELYQSLPSSITLEILDFVEYEHPHSEISLPEFIVGRFKKEPTDRRFIVYRRSILLSASSLASFSRNALGLFCLRQVRYLNCFISGSEDLQKLFTQPKMASNALVSIDIDTIYVRGELDLSWLPQQLLKHVRSIHTSAKNFTLNKEIIQKCDNLKHAGVLGGNDDEQWPTDGFSFEWLPAATLRSLHFTKLASVDDLESIASNAPQLSSLTLCYSRQSLTDEVLAQFRTETKLAQLPRLELILNSSAFPAGKVMHNVTSLILYSDVAMQSIQGIEQLPKLCAVTFDFAKLKVASSWNSLALCTALKRIAFRAILTNGTLATAARQAIRQLNARGQLLEFTFVTETEVSPDWLWDCGLGSEPKCAIEDVHLSFSCTEDVEEMLLPLLSCPKIRRIGVSCDRLENITDVLRTYLNECGLLEKFVHFV